MRLSIILSFLAVLSPISIASSYADDEQKSETFLFENVTWLHINDSDAFSVVVDDQVTGGCWRYPQATKTAVELELQRSGFNISSPEGGSITLPSVVIHSLGFKAGDQSCVVSVRLEVITYVITRYLDGGHQLTGLTKAPLYYNAGVLISPVGDVSDRIKTSHIEFVQAFLVEIKRRRSEILYLAAGAAAAQEEKSHWEDLRRKTMHQQ